MRPFRHVGYLLVLGVACAATAEPVRLPEVTVESSPIDPYLSARTEIEREEIIESHKSDLSDVLDLTPGVNARQGGRGEPRIDVRGFDQRAVLFTLNGVPIYEPWNGVINVNLFPLEMLDGIEVTRGATSSLYGPNGMAGQIKLSTFAPRAPLGAALSTIWRDPELFDVRASGSAQRDGVSGFVAGRYLSSPHFNLADGFDDRPDTERRDEDGGARLNSDIEQLSGFGSLGYEYGSGGRAHLAVLASESSFGVPPSTTQFAPMYRRTDPQQLFHAQAGVDQPILGTLRAAGGIFFTAYNLDEEQYEAADFETLLLTTSTESREVGGIGRLTVDIGKNDSLAIAGQVRSDSARVTNTVRGFLSDPEFVIGSIAAENVYALTQRISLIAGLSYDTLSGGGQKTRDEINPQGIVSVDLGRWGNSHVAVGRKVRFPTLRELFDPVQGNEDLNPERTITYEIGHQATAPWGYAALNLFRSDVDGLIDPRGGDQSAFINFEEATLQGVELAAGVQYRTYGRLDANYTYLDTDSAADEPGLASEVQHKPAHRFNGILELWLPWQLRLRMEGLYTSKQLELFASSVFVDDFVLWNVQLTRPIGNWLSLFVGCDNLLDVDYEEKLGAPEPGRRAFVGFRATY